MHTPDGFVDGRCGRGLSDPNPSTHMIEIIKVPVADPAAAEVVKEWRLFADEETGAVNGLQNGPTRQGHPCTDVPHPVDPTRNSCAPAGNNYSPSPNTNTCHDITVYPEVGLAAGACQGNGILIDISDPADPVRLDYVADENFAYWHSANFSNDGETVNGIISERDVVRALHRDGADILNGPVSAIMTSQVVTCEPMAQLADIAALMTERRFRHMPVVKETKIVSIVSIGDAVKARITQIEAERDHLMEYIHQ